MPDFDLELKQITKIYPGGTLAVEAFDLQVKRGEFLSFVGPSGCGKTTTLRMIAGLEDITAGELFIRGINNTRVKAEDRPTATIFQNYAIYPHMTVQENIEFGLKVRKLPYGEIRRRTSEVMELLDLGEVAKAKENSLSGGQKQRVALARGLVTEPEILLLDEPLGALDANLRRAIQDELKLLQRKLGITFVFVTHAQSEALGMGDRVVVMNSGRVEQIGNSQDIYFNPRSTFVAKFIGKNLIFEGTARTSSNGRTSIIGPLGRFEGNSFSVHSEHDPCIAVIPSEFVKFTKKPPDSKNFVTGKIEQVSFVQNLVILYFKTADGCSHKVETHVDKIVGSDLTAGSGITISWKSENSTILSGER
tara:strand:+ start:5150 stop:6238 length:1089 start_codon:yes stop_codon:yes gene_type:complete